MGKSKKILVIAGGGKKHLSPFKKEAERLGVNLEIASFSDLKYKTGKKDFSLEVNGKDVGEYPLIYIRLVGKRFEDASLLVSYAKKKNLRIVDAIYQKSQYIRLPLAKALETKLLVQAGVSVPETYFAGLADIVKRGPKIFGFPFVIKGTVGKQGHAVWSPRNKKELERIVGDLVNRERKGERFLAQEFIYASQRNRVLVIGGKAIAAITRPTRWRRRFIEKVAGEFPPGKRQALKPVSKEDARLAEKAAKALSVDIAGVDIIHDDKTGKVYVLEVNSAPRWEAIRKDCKLNVEAEIVKFLSSLI